MKSASHSPTPAAWVGPVCGIASAVLYTLTNIALRNCVDVDAYLVSAVKAAPTVIVLGPLIGWLTIRSADSDPILFADSTVVSLKRRIPQFILASFLAQFFGNAAFQKALEHIGLAASVPITLGVLIVGGAVLGALMLKEPVGSRKVVAMVTLILAVIVLSLPHGVDPTPSDSDPSPKTATRQTDPIEADKPRQTDQGHSVEIQQPEPQQPGQQRNAVDVIVGSLWAAVSGLAYAFFGVTMRQTLQSGIPARTLMFFSGLTGTITLWAYCFVTLGYDSIAATSPSQWAIMFTAGFCNFSAFIAITTALRLLPVVAVNLINASQVAMAAVAGVVLFGEPITSQLALGIFMTLVGLIILARRTRAPIVITD